MENKILIELIVPELEAKYDIFIPIPYSVFCVFFAPVILDTIHCLPPKII